ncbi:response regulator transcription factor [Nocardioides dongkuii]|uniref:response regulator transcription factor n=1 Tax=Nocardioides dongkuii TaxID=2760089 RepID=UPI0029D41802|nr:response regulator transcription factor [Nocardioides dongkuii]
MALSNDYEIVLLGLAQLLAPYADQVQIVGMTSATTMPHEADVILYDTFSRLPDHDEKLRKVVNENAAKVAVFSWDDYPEDEARRRGAAGYIHKGLDGGELVAAILAIHRDQQPERPEAGAEEPRRTWPGQTLDLSEREAEVLTLITRGLSNHEIAERSYLSVNTIKTYIRHAYRKIGVSTRAQAVVWGYRNGFASTSDVQP